MYSSAEPLNPYQRVQPTAFTPCEPRPQLERIEGVGAPGVPGEVEDCLHLGRRRRCWLERQTVVRVDTKITSRGDPTPVLTSPAANAATHLELVPRV